MLLGANFTSSVVGLGYFWNMIEGKLYVTEDRIKRLELSMESVFLIISNSKTPLVKVRLLPCIVGQIISMQTVLGKMVQLRTRKLYRCIRASWNAPVKVTVEAVGELDYCRSNIRSINAKGQYVTPNLDSQILIYSDASGEGYRGYASYCDTVNANVATDSTYSGNISDTVKVNCEIYSNISDRHMECSEENECGFL